MLHYNIEELWIFLNLMAISGYSKALHLTDVSMEGEEGVHDVISEYVIPAYKPSSIISLTFALF